MTNQFQSPPPIFILGIMPRSGTNFLHQLICLHPDCTPTLAWEDFVIYPASLLDAYAHAVYHKWIPLTTAKLEPVIKSPVDTLLRHLGDGLLAFLYTQQPREKRLVTKTPWVTNLPYVFKLFPEAKLLLLVRDGRAVVESGTKSCWWDEEASMRQWAHAAQDIIQFKQDNQHLSHQYLILKYEDLYLNTVETMTDILTFLSLDAESYDFKLAVEAPVLGSSDSMKQYGKIHWQPVEKTSDFTPLSRWQTWDDAKHTLFNQIAGKQMVQLGYALQGVQVNFDDSTGLSTCPTVCKDAAYQSGEPVDSPDEIVQKLLRQYQTIADTAKGRNGFYTEG